MWRFVLFCLLSSAIRRAFSSGEGLLYWNPANSQVIHDCCRVLWSARLTLVHKQLRCWSGGSYNGEDQIHQWNYPRANMEGRNCWNIQNWKTSSSQGGFHYSDRCKRNASEF